MRNQGWLQMSNTCLGELVILFEGEILSGLMSPILHISTNTSPKFLSRSGTQISGFSEQVHVVEIGSRTFSPD